MSTIPVETFVLCSRHRLQKEASASSHQQLSQKPKYGAGRSFVGVKHDLLPRL